MALADAKVGTIELRIDLVRYGDIKQPPRFQRQHDTQKLFAPRVVHEGTKKLGCHQTCLGAERFTAVSSLSGAGPSRDLSRPSKLVPSVATAFLRLFRRNKLRYNTPHWGMCAMYIITRKYRIWKLTFSPPYPIACRCI